MELNHMHTEYRRTGGAYFLFLAALTCFALGMAPGAARGAPDPGKAQKQLGKGCGTILGGDAERAADEAVIAARRSAIEKAFGVLVDAETIVKNSALFDSFVKNKTGGFVKSFEILSKKQTAGRVCVEIEAWVLPRKLKERLNDLVSNISVIVQIPETNCGRRSRRAIVENMIIKKLVRSNYKVLDARRSSAINRRDISIALEGRDKRAAARLRLKFLSNIIIGGEAATEISQRRGRIVSARAEVEARVVVAETGQVLEIFSAESKGFRRNCRGAGRNALRKAGKQASDDIVKALDEYIHRSEREVEIHIRGIPNDTIFRKIGFLVKSERWVTMGNEPQYSRDNSVYFVKYPEKTIYLATSLARKPELRLKLEEFGWTRAVLRYVQ